MLSRSILTFGFGLILSASTLVQAASICNGHSELCDKKYSNVTFLGAHNSYAVGQSIADNQNKNVTEQLNDGIRTLQVQTHNATDGIHLCHSSCSLVDAGLLSDWLGSVATWVKANPTEVISIVLVNMDNLPATSFSAAFETAGLSDYAYTPSSSATSLSDWPTLGTLVDTGKTVVVFMNYNADFSTAPYIIDEFSNMWEDAYDVTETGWACAVNRSSGNSGSMMMLVNHFLDQSYSFGSTQFFIPAKDELNTTNSEASLSLHVNNCNSIWGRAPNHILLDFYDTTGNVPFDYVAQLNGVSDPTNTVTPYAATAVATASSSSGSGNSAVITQSSLSSAETRVSIGVVKWMSGLAVGVVGMVVGGVIVGL